MIDHYVLFVDTEGRSLPEPVFACDQRTPIDPFNGPLPGTPRCATCTRMVESGEVA